MGAALEKSFFLTWPTLAPNGQAGTEDAAPCKGRGELLGRVGLEQSAEGSASQERSGGVFLIFKKKLSDQSAKIALVFCRFEKAGRIWWVLADLGKAGALRKEEGFIFIFFS